MRSIAHSFVALALVTLAGAALAQFRWTDADGRVSFGDSPPPGARNVQRLGESASSRAAAADLPYELRIAVERFPVTLYTAPNCQPCNDARAFLRARGVPVTERTVTYKEEAEKMQRDGLGTQMPVATVGRNVMRAFNPAVWSRELDAAGYPAQSRLPAGWQAPAPQPLLEPPKSRAAAPAAPPDDEPRAEVPKGVATPDQPLVWPPPPPPPNN